MPFTPAERDAQLRLISVRLISRIFHQSYRERLAYIGYARPVIGSIPPLAELQARYVALVISGRRALPAKDAARRSIDAAEQVARREFELANGQLWLSLVNFLPYMDELARLVGCRPSPALCFTDPLLALRVIFGPSIAAHYRLSGPGARTALARASIMSLPSGGARVRDQLFYAALHCLSAPFALLATMLDADTGVVSTLI